MSNMIEFTVYGTAVPKQRPRISGRRAYTPKRTKDYEERVLNEFRSSYSGFYPAFGKDTPVSVEIRIGQAIPKSWPKKKRLQAELGDIVPLSRNGDIDNIAKSILRSVIRHISEKDGISVKMGDLSVFVKLCLDDSAVDMDSSKVLSIGEAAVLALAGSFDSAATGLSCGGKDISALGAAAAVFICGAAALILGSLTGRKISSLNRDFSWTGGLFLILFAVFSA